MKQLKKSKKAVTAADKTELGRKYLTELNYTEAVASFLRKPSSWTRTTFRRIWAVPR